MESTEEILLECRPLMYPLDSKAKLKAAIYLSAFLPTYIARNGKNTATKPSYE